MHMTTLVEFKKKLNQDNLDSFFTTNNNFDKK